MRAEDRPNRRWDIVRDLLNQHDPMGLIAIGCPRDEYDPEIPSVLAAIADAPDRPQLRALLIAAFEKAFPPSPTEPAVGLMEWDALAHDLWNAARTPEWKLSSPQDHRGSW